MKKYEVTSPPTGFTELVNLALKPEDSEMDSCISKVSEKDIEYVNREISRHYDGEKARVTFDCPADAKPGLAIVFEEGGWKVNTKIGLLVWEFRKK